MSEAEGRYESAGSRVLVLAAQSFTLGLTMAWIVIPASAVFLAAYGSGLLPATYIGAAAAGILSSSALAAALRRRALPAVAIRVLAGLAVALAASWIVLRSAHAEWVSFALLVLVPIVVPVGFVFVVGQAGMLLDVRALKASYARVVAGFALGFVVGGLGGPPLIALLGRTEDLLAAAAVAATGFLLLVAVTRRRHPTELSMLEPSDDEAPAPTLRTMSRHRFIVLIVAFQMLSAVESQWLDFLVFDRAAHRYADSNRLADFVSRFSVIAYGTDIVFLLVVAGFLLRRFGLRYGLTANALGVASLIGGIIVAGAIQGSGATFVFVLIVGARVTDLTLSDGTSRTSLSAAYQAVPTRLRAVAQSAVEGLAVPVAIGISGVGLLVVDAAGGTDGMAVPVLTGLVVAAWVVVAALVYREYRVNLLENLRGRTLDPADLAVASESSLIAIDRLVGSGDERDVRLGLDILTIARHPELPARLQRLVVDERVNVRTDALDRLVRLAPRMAAEAAREGVRDSSPEVRAASIRVLGVARSRSDCAHVAACARDDATEVRVAVVFALSRMGDAATRTDIAADIARLTRSVSPADRALAALMVRQLDPDAEMDRSVLTTLLDDRDPGVVNAALSALRGADDLHLLPAVAARLDDRRTADAAAEALIRCGDAALDLVDEALLGDALGVRARSTLVHTAREIGGPSAVALLRRHVEHADREIGLVVMKALAALGPSGTGASHDPPGPDDAEPDPLESALVRDELEHATHVLRALVAFADEPAASVQCAALRDELDLVRRRVLAALSMRHGTAGLNRVTFQLAQRDARSHALALEWLEDALAGAERGVVALLEPGLSERDRLSALTRRFSLPALSRDEILLDLVLDPDARWRPWIAACGLYTAAHGANVDGSKIMEAATGISAVDPDGSPGIVRETMDGIRERRRDLV